MAARVLGIGLLGFVYHETLRFRPIQHQCEWEVHNGLPSSKPRGPDLEVKEYRVNTRMLHEVPNGGFQWGYITHPGRAEWYAQSMPEFSLQCQRMSRLGIPHHAFVACFITEDDETDIAEVDLVNPMNANLDDINTRMGNFVYRRVYPRTKLTGRMFLEKDCLAYGIVVDSIELTDDERKRFNDYVNHRN